MLARDRRNLAAVYDCRQLGRAVWSCQRRSADVRGGPQLRSRQPRLGIVLQLAVWPRGGREEVMPTISNDGIIFFTTTAAAAGRRDNWCRSVSCSACFAMLMPNLGGFLIGYLMSRWIFRMDVQSARTVAFEVGLQNGGMASGSLPPRWANWQR